ncbi:Glycosyl Hydrolase Family 16 [Abortiporus biennis]
MFTLYSTFFFFAFITVSAFVSVVSADASFVLDTKWVGHDFLNGDWQFFDGDDPTHGQVNYVDESAASSTNLTFATNSKFIMQADPLNTVAQGARGRNSVRISSVKAWDESLVVLDLQHMPAGCGTWPAFWTVSQKGPWPTGGEVDIIEGVNKQQANQATLHTLPSCQMPDFRNQTGNTFSGNCDAVSNSNSGCGVGFTKSASFGEDFNNAGGGFYVMARTSAEIRIWFWSRQDQNIPQEITNGAASITPQDSWGVPDAHFTFGDGCNYQQHFDAHSLIFDLTFCGDWAGNTFNSDGCSAPGNSPMGQCIGLVNSNPSQFLEAYWEVNSLRVYQKNTLQTRQLGRR